MLWALCYKHDSPSLTTQSISRMPTNSCDLHTVLLFQLTSVLCDNTIHLASESPWNAIHSLSKLTQAIASPIRYEVNRVQTANCSVTYNKWWHVTAPLIATCLVHRFLMVQLFFPPFANCLTCYHTRLHITSTPGWLTSTSHHTHTHYQISAC
jgi:hypothetical protein